MKYYDIAYSYSVKKQFKKFHFCFIYTVSQSLISPFNMIWKCLYIGYMKY